MSLETSKWLNTNTLIGFTEKRGQAWHYRADQQGEQTNHYPLAIPIEDVRDRLFFWKAVEGTVESTATILLPEGVESFTITDPERKTIIRPDTKEILGVFKKGYKIHDYEEWLLNKVAFLLDDELEISSAGLLRKGGVAWVEVSVPDTIVTPEGVTFRPNLLAGTSLDGSLSTTYARTITNTVCDNTMSAALSEAINDRIKVRHSVNSLTKLAEARESLSLVHTLADEFAEQVKELCNTTVTDGQWKKFLDEILPTEGKEGRGLTIATNKREALDRLYTYDSRVAPWTGTAYGVVQAVNTAVHHEFTVQGDRSLRNAEKALTGDFDALDASTLASLVKVTA